MARQIITELIADSTKFTKGTRDATKAAESMSSQLKGSVLAGVGIGAGISAFGLVSGAISGTVGFLGDAVKAGMDEEESISKLSASLKANVDGWDGNTAAIEKTMQAGIDLGFSDEEQRASLARLVAATHDVTDAMQLERTAMDLARFKGISLEEASQALINIDGGRYKALGQLIGSTKEITSRTEALAAVQRVAGGQAADYASTTSGKLLVAQTKFGEKMDELGSKTLPLVTGGIGLLTDAMKGLDYIMGDIAQPAQTAVVTLDNIKSGADLVTASFNSQHDAMAHAMGQLTYAEQLAKDNISKFAEQTQTEAYHTSAAVSTSMGDVSAAAGRTAEDVQKAADAMKSDFGSLASYMLGYYTSDINRAFDIEDARTGLSADRSEQASLRKRIASGDLTAKETTDAEARMTVLDREEADHYAKLAEAGALSKSDYTAWAAVLTRLAAGTKGAVHAAYVAALADIANLRNASATPVTVTVVYKKKVTGSNADPVKSAGGNRFPVGGLSWVGEEGKELVYVPPGGEVFSNPDSMRMAGGGTPASAGVAGGRGGMSVNVYGNIYGPSGVDELMDMMARRLKLDGV